MHPVQQHTGHPLQAVGQEGQTLDYPPDGAEDDEQHLVHRLNLLQLLLDLLQTYLVIHQGLERKTIQVQISLTFFF